MKHKIIPVILCLMLCVALMPAAAFAEGETPAAQDDTWTVYAAENFAGGSGTKADPYQIGTPQQLAKLAKDVNGGETYAGKYFKLTADLDLSEHVWMPIGLYRTNAGSQELIKIPFAGSFDGGGRMISGMIVDQRKSLSERYSGGLFGLIRNIDAKECGVRNLTIADGKIYFNGDDATEYMGNGILAGVAGDRMAKDVYHVDFEGNKISGGSIQCSGGEGRDRVAGGMLGYVTNARVSDCSVENIRIFGVSNSGGFVGQDQGSTYSNCTATGELSGYWSLGGFVGFTTYFTIDGNKHFDPVFQHCLADVDITADDWSAGGFMGWADYAHVFNCVAKGNVTSTKVKKGDELEDPRAGAFVGVMAGCNIEKSHAAGRVTEAAPDYEAGGFAAHFNESGNKFKDCSFDSTLNNGVKAIGGKEPKDYDGITGVPTQQVKANICRDYYGNHILKEVTGKDATCTENGVETYWKCDACGSMYSDKDGTTMIDSPIVIPATGHKLTSIAKKPATCTEDGHEAYWECENCGLFFADENGTQQIEKPIIPATGHKFGDWKVIKEAKVGVEGSRERACVNCDYTETETIPALEAQDTAKTGDDSNVALYGILALLAAGGAAGTLYRRRKA